MPRHHKIAEIAAALRLANGEPSIAARGLGFTPQAIGQRIAKSAELKAVIAEIKADLLPLARSGMADLIRDKDGVTIRWYLERMDREFSNKVQASFDEAQLEAFAASFGGDPKKLRSTLDRIRAQRAPGGMGRA